MRKRNTTGYAIGGKGGGANNQNQQWKKVSVGGGAHRLYKRNATACNINGGNVALTSLFMTTLPPADG